MECVKCSKPAEVVVLNLAACRPCFFEIIQKRVRKEARQNRFFRRGDRILVVDDGSAQAQASKYLLKRIIKDLPVKIITEKMGFQLGEVPGEYGKIVIPWDADREGEYFLDCVFNNKEMPYLGHYTLNKKRYIKLLLPVLGKEVEAYAKLKGLRYKRVRPTEISRMLDRLEKDYPETRFALVKSSQDIRLLNQKG